MNFNSVLAVFVTVIFAVPSLQSSTCIPTTATTEVCELATSAGAAAETIGCDIITSVIGCPGSYGLATSTASHVCDPVIVSSEHCESATSPASHGATIGCDIVTQTITPSSCPITTPPATLDCAPTFYTTEVCDGPTSAMGPGMTVGCDLYTWTMQSAKCTSIAPVSSTLSYPNCAPETITTEICDAATSLATAGQTIGCDLVTITTIPASCASVHTSTAAIPPSSVKTAGLAPVLSASSTSLSASTTHTSILALYSGTANKESAYPGFLALAMAMYII